MKSLKTSLKKLTYTVATALLVVTGFVTTNVQAKANTSDSSFDFKFKGNSTAYTPVRTKYNSTSAYINVKTISDGDPYYKASLVKSNGQNFSKTWTYTFGTYDAENPKLAKHYIKNYAMEDSKGSPVKVKIKARGYRGISANYNWHSRGVWSPDSI
ncbi:hypothetical protein [Bacillus halotolerans]|uniref:hypothetical protein n=1 Tax=Bacillus halotolerans TaxID=260554 RepID=UPI00201B9198|nr:hypothetical protein [Bacillus halotolerans]MEC3639089.1 hypothetical protein [Bacillus halotolerans]MEC3758005.1 hypothetical protein [Bacillus halotolerans]